MKIVVCVVINKAGYEVIIISADQVTCGQVASQWLSVEKERP